LTALQIYEDIKDARVHCAVLKKRTAPKHRHQPVTAP
jgi:hypothetical protein